VGQIFIILIKGGPMKLLYKDNVAAVIFALPFIIGFLAFLVAPMLISLYYAFTDFNLLRDPRWIGLGNFRRMLGDARLHNSLRATFYFAFTSVPLRIMFALAIAARDEYRAGNIAGAVGDYVSWMLFVIGLIMYGAGSMGAVPSQIASAGRIAAIIGALLVFWSAGRETRNVFAKFGSGLYALYGITGYMGDILSYSRLLALGLGSGVVGAVVNLLCLMAVDIPYIGWLFAIVIFVGGHLFNMAINLLGSFVHSMRLQFVEFFGKFYSGGGVSFNPLRLQTQYVEIFDEN